MGQIEKLEAYQKKTERVCEAIVWTLRMFSEELAEEIRHRKNNPDGDFVVPRDYLDPIHTLRFQIDRVLKAALDCTDDLRATLTGVKEVLHNKPNVVTEGPDLSEEEWLERHNQYLEWLDKWIDALKRANHIREEMNEWYEKEFKPYCHERYGDPKH